jgi:hypothetical protein
MPETLLAADVIAAASAAEAALRPVIGRDWSVRAGPLEWSVEQTVTHMIAATAKYTLYLASRCEHFIGLSISRWPDATNQEVIDSLVPVATGLANVAAASPPGARAYHVTGSCTAAHYVGPACGQNHVPTHDALTGLGAAIAPPSDLCRRVLAQQFPDAVVAGEHDDPWRGLLAATGRPPH